MSSNSTARRGPGICAIRGGCGKKSIFDPELPCPDDGDADPVTPELKKLLEDVCGPAFVIPDAVCCTQGQLKTLQDNLLNAEPIIASCPACRNNFRSFYCHFTCSPDQSEFVQVVRTQEVGRGPVKQVAVKEVDFVVSDKFRDGFFDSCKDVQFGATNSFSMDLIGGGAKDSQSFVKYMGTERPGLGSPFQISFPPASSIEDPSIIPLLSPPLACYGADLSARCTCVDCPSICPTLPYLPPPANAAHNTCHVGAISCLTFILILTYGISALVALSVYTFNYTIKHRRRQYERVALFSDESPLSPTTSNPPSTGRQRSRSLGGRSQRREGDGDSFPSISTGQMGRGESLLDPIEALQPRRHGLNTFLRIVFYKIGLFCAQKPFQTFAIASVMLAFLNAGWSSFSVETDPVRLWVAPGSDAASEKHSFDVNFGPFYRPQQIFITATNSPIYSTDGDIDYTLPSLSHSRSEDAGPVMTYERLKWWLSHESEIRSLRSEPNGYTLQDVCFSPAGPGTPCVVQSVSAWFGENPGEGEWKELLAECAERPAECLPDFGQPIEPKFVLGEVKGKEWESARSLVVTFVVSDSLDQEVKAKAVEWETSLRKYLQNVAANAYSEAGAGIAFSTGVSLEEELNKSTNTDYKTVIFSYLLMFFYIAATLGGGLKGGDSFLRLFRDLAMLAYVSMHRGVLRLSRRVKGNGISLPEDFEAEEFSNDTSVISISRILALLFDIFSIKSKVTLGLFGIIMVLVAVSTSVGVFSFLDVKVTLIIAEVIPFLVLAVGVDNVFILVHELDRQNLQHGPKLLPEISRYMNTDYLDEDNQEEPNAASSGYLAPEERVARTLARMGPSIFLSAATETVAFALGAIVPMPAVRNFALYAAGSVVIDAMLQVTVFVSAMALDLRRVESGRMDCLPCIQLHQPVALSDDSPATQNGESGTTRFMRKYFAPSILKTESKGFVVALFSGLFVLALIGMQHISIGLDQRLALPRNSYLIPYFDSVDRYLEIGPPVYFVADHLDVSTKVGQQAICGRFTTCQELSIANTLEAERKRPEVSYLANPPAVWIDDFLNFLNPVIETCCRVRIDDPDTFCAPSEPERRCQPCFLGRDPPFDITMDGLPEGEEFMKYLLAWLNTPTDATCPLGGQASYGSALSLSNDNSSVIASHFRTFHTPLKTQQDFILALASAKRISEDLSKRMGAKVFAYSLFYVYFDQYAYIVTITVQVLGVALVAIFAINSLLLGSWRTGAVVTFVCALSVFDVMGVMGVWGISLNAISLVNLVISLGISVEFCAHVARSFMNSSGRSRDERAWSALVDVGPSVFSGITMTKLIGISVLAFTRSKLLEAYFFRMWLSLIISGAIHGLILLPVLLSMFGGKPYDDVDFDSDFLKGVISSSAFDYNPLQHGDDDSEDGSL